MYPAAQNSHPNSGFVTSFLNLNSQKATKDNQQNHKIGKKDNYTPGTGLSQQSHDFYSWLLSSKTIIRRLILSSWSVICPVRSLSQSGKAKKKIELFQKMYFRR